MALLSLRSGAGVRERSEKAASLKYALDIGSKFLKKADQVFLRRILLGEDPVKGDVPTFDWKKLNRDATFKMKYKARSVGIEKAIADYKELKAAKDDELGRVHGALGKLDEETA